MCYYNNVRKIINKSEVNSMAKKNNTQGWYLFEDGYYCWYHGLSAQEKKIEIRQHGQIVKFTPT
jgi:hypothetical protein